MSANNSDVAEPNLTPLLDMVFQLITFFMLVINFKGASMDMSLKLPVLGSARPLEYHGVYQAMMLNINNKGQVLVTGQVVDIDNFVKTEANMLKLQLQAAGVKRKEGEEFPVPVIIRADKSVHFKELNKVIETCQKHGYRQFSLSAMTREEQN
jgi:biopolymer transport protein ExbD